MANLKTYQPSFSAGVLAPALCARTDLRAYATGLQVGENIIIHPHGGASNRAGFKFIGAAVGTGGAGRLIPFQFSNDQTYVLDIGAGKMRFYRNGALIMSGGSPYEIDVPWNGDDLRSVVYAQEADVMYLVCDNVAPRKLSRLADNNWTLTAVTFGPKITAPASITATVQSSTAGQPGYTATQYRYKVAAVSAESGEESLPTAASTAITNDLSVSGGINRISWPAVTGADRYIVYKEDNGVYGYIGGTSALRFDDENITADLSDTPQTARNPFNGANKYPRCVSFVEQRLVFAGTKEDPQAVWMSQSAAYENFGYSQPAKASDAVTFRIKARQVNEIRAILPVKAMMLLSSAAEWVVSGGSQSDAITPSSIKIDNHGNFGASAVQPLAVGNTVLFSQARGGVVRDFSYDFASDGYSGKDLTIFARHYFEGREIRAWTYAQAPHSIVWVVLNDGSLVSMTYVKEHEVWAWTEHKSGAGGMFLDVISVAEGVEDAVYVIVRRTIGGVLRYYIERLHTRAFSDVKDAFFVDSGLTYRGNAVSSVSGLGHLEGQSVVALADGNVVRGLTVTSGSVTLPYAAKVIHVGLEAPATLQTLDIDLGQVQGIGTVQSRTKSVPKVSLRVEKTRGIWFGHKNGNRGDSHLIEYKQRSDEPYGVAIGLKTGTISTVLPPGWNDHGSIWVKQFDPLPFTILAIIPELVIGK